VVEHDEFVREVMQNDNAVENDVNEVAAELVEQRVQLLRDVAGALRAYPGGGPNLRDKHLAEAKRLGLDVGQIADQWDHVIGQGRRPYANLGIRPVSGPPRPAPAETPASDKRPSEIEAASSVSGKANIADEPASVEAVQEVLRDASNKLKADVKGALEQVKAKRSIEEIAALAAQHQGQIITPGALVAHNADEWMAAMNERHAVIGNIGGKCKVLEWVPSELDEGALIASYQSKADFINRYAQQQMGWTSRGAPLTLGQWWFDNPHRADYRGVVFKPGKPAIIVRPDGSWLNLCRGWGVIPERGKWPLLRNFVQWRCSDGGIQHPLDCVGLPKPWRCSRGSVGVSRKER
jgi:hypothetical protein